MYAVNRQDGAEVNLIWSPAHMAVFAKVVDMNGFSAAARALKVPKAAVSRSISQLEAELGLKLLERTTRRLHLTPAGEVLLPHCRRILGESDAVRETALQLGAQHGGTLRVRGDATWGRVLLTPLVPRFLERFSDIPLDVELGAFDEDPLADSWDVALRVGASDNPALVSRALGSPPALLCATPAYLQKRGAPTIPEELDRHDLLTPAQDAQRHVLRFVQGNRRAEVTITPKLAVNDPALLHSSTAAGLGIGLLPEFLCKQGLATGKLKRVLEDWELPEQPPLCAITPARLAQDVRVIALVDFLAANLVPALAASP